MLAPWKESCNKPRWHIKKQRHQFADKGPYSQSYAFSSIHVQMWKMDHKEGWELKNWCFWSAVLEMTLESPLDCKVIKPVNPKKKSTLNIHWKDWCWSWSAILWSPDAKSRLLRKDPDAGKDWGQGENGATGDKMVGQHHWPKGHEFEQSVGDSKRTGKPSMLQSMVSHRIRHNLETEEQQ